jgi:flagellin-like hook-associated protein FlgL
MALRRTAEEITQAQLRLATGLRVNSAVDNPAAFFTASALTVRASALTAVYDGIGNTKQVLEAAMAGVEAVQSLIASARDLANEARASASTIAKVTGTVGGLTGSSVLSNFENGDTITVNDGVTTATFTYNTGTSNTLQHFIDTVNNSVALNVDASLSDDGRVVLTATSTNNITIGGSSSTTEKADIGLVAATTSFTTNTLRQALAQEVNALRTQIGTTAGDSSYNGLNLLAGSSLTVNFNETGTSQLTVTGLLATADALGITTVSGDFQLDSEITAFIDLLDNASATLEVAAVGYSTSLAVVGARETFTDSMIDIMHTGADDLVLADTDEDSALLLALQARQKLAATTLSMAGQESLPALRLFGW